MSLENFVINVRGGFSARSSHDLTRHGLVGVNLRGAASGFWPLSVLYRGGDFNALTICSTTSSRGRRASTTIASAGLSRAANWLSSNSFGKK